MASNLIVISQLRALGGAVCQICFPAKRELRVRQENRTTIYMISVIIQLNSCCPTAKTPIKDPGSTDFDIIKLQHLSFLFTTIH
jgi:hypothetical protein